MEEPNLADALKSADLKDQDQWEEEDQGEDQREDANMENLRDPLVVDDARSADASHASHTSSVLTRTLTCTCK